MTLSISQAISAKRREIELTKQRIQALNNLLQTQKKRKIAITKTKETGRTYRISKRTGKVTSMTEDDERILEHLMKTHKPKEEESNIGRRLPIIPKRN